MMLILPERMQIYYLVGEKHTQSSPCKSDVLMLKCVTLVYHLEESVYHWEQMYPQLLPAKHA